MKFKGKVGLWFYALILFLNGMLVYTMLFDREGLVIMLLVTIVIDLIFIPMLIRNYIMIRDDIMTIYLGFSKEEVKISKIREVYPTYNPIASGALSLDRIMICTTGSDYMCSVYDKKGLFLALQKVNPRIRFTGRKVI